MFCLLHSLPSGASPTASRQRVALSTTDSIQSRGSLFRHLNFPAQLFKAFFFISSSRQIIPPPPPLSSSQGACRSWNWNVPCSVPEEADSLLYLSALFWMHFRAFLSRETLLCLSKKKKKKKIYVSFWELNIDPQRSLKISHLDIVYVYFFKLYRHALLESSVTWERGLFSWNLAATSMKN